MTDTHFKGWAKPGPIPPGARSDVQVVEDETLDAISGHFRTRTGKGELDPRFRFAEGKKNQPERVTSFLASLAAVHWGAAQWPHHDNTDSNIALNERKRTA